MKWIWHIILFWLLGANLAWGDLPRPTVTNIYDTGANLSQVKQVGGSGTVYYSASGFNALDQLTGINFGNGVATTYSYFANSHRLQSVTTSKGGNLQSLSYTYDQVSDVLSITDGVYTGAASASLSSVNYDDLHRLTSLTRNGQTVTFGYSSIGNITTNGENGTAAYGYGTRLPHAVKSANGTNYAYDQNGNMLTRGNQELVYDPENRLAMVVMSNSTVTFGYDASGTRLWKQGALTNSLQVWIDGNYEEKDGKVLFHIMADGRTVCTFDSTGATLEYYHSDHLHSTAVQTDGSGNLYQHYEYSVYGQSRYTSSTTAFPVSRRYTSQVLDEETGLYYYGARYYDPQLGRFVQPDTIISSEFNPQSYDRYAYALNNPLKYVDPSGHAPWKWYIPGYSSILEVQGQQALDEMVRAHTDFGSYNEMLKNKRLNCGNGDVTAGNMEALAADAHVAAAGTSGYITVAPEIATAGLATGAVVCEDGRTRRGERGCRRRGRRSRNWSRREWGCKRRCRTRFKCKQIQCTITQRMGTGKR
jgi:RHS repeat-associated protein